MGLELDGKAQQQVGGIKVEVAETEFRIEGQIGKDVVIGPQVSGSYHIQHEPEQTHTQPHS
ncbi:hypothetical protein, partial [Meiothermus cerbereus]|uniref:hypothetical protein n=1 Tax=Meiothermus cerbereus TaxID=65552 RepID=UPI003EEC8BFA